MLDDLLASGGNLQPPSGEKGPEGSPDRLGAAAPGSPGGPGGSKGGQGGGRDPKIPSA